MITFKLNEKQYNLPTEWSEITLADYIELASIKADMYKFSELYVMRILEILTKAEPGDLDDMSLEGLNDLSARVAYLNEEPKYEITQHVEIEGKDYAFPENLYQIKAGEYISIKTLQENEKDPTQFYLNLLSILLRPSTKVLDTETGKEKWVQEKFKAENLEYRKELYKKLPITKVMGTINFFLNGKDISMNNIAVSIKDGVVETKLDQ